MEQVSGYIKLAVATLAVVIITFISFGFFWFLFFTPQAGLILAKFWWYVLSFTSGLTMSVLPCVLPLAFVIVPLSMGRNRLRGVGMAVAFGAGVMLMLSAYGILVAYAGKWGLSLVGLQTEDIKNWMYVFGGIFTYIFALSEIGLLNFHMPSYTGGAPQFLEKHRDLAKAFFLGIFLGNIGVGCPHPAMPLIIVEVASSGNIFYGWSMFFVNAVGRVLPLIALALLGVLGVNGLNWFLARKEGIRRASGWAMVFVAGFILTLGLFTQLWWVNSDQHNFLENITQGLVSQNHRYAQLQTGHMHTMENMSSVRGIFGQPAEWGNIFLIVLWFLPLWLTYFREKKRIQGTPLFQIQKLERQLEKAEDECRSMEVLPYFSGNTQNMYAKEIETQINVMTKERVILEEAMRYGSKNGLRDVTIQTHEEEALRMRRNWYFTVTLLFLLLFFL